MSCSVLHSGFNNTSVYNTGDWVMPMSQMFTHWLKRNGTKDYLKDAQRFAWTFNYPEVIKNPKLKAIADKRRNLYLRRKRGELFRGYKFIRHPFNISKYTTPTLIKRLLKRK